MFSQIKNFIKTKPRLYDFFDSMRPVEGEVEKWLESYASETNKSINFIQIGASDGLRWDPFRRFIIKHKWSGVFVEPLPNVFEILKRNYEYVKGSNFEFVNAAISTGEGDYIDIWSYSDEFCNTLSLEERMFYLRKSSLDRRHVEASLSGYDKISDKLKCFRVSCVSINDLIDRYFSDKELDLLLIDAEGHDDKIVRTIDFSKKKPGVILFEAHNLVERKQEIHKYLTDKGYTVKEIGGDSVAVLNRDSE